jgi:hypothetical protein
VIIGVISRGEMVVGGLISGGVRSPTVLRSTRDRRCAGVEVVLSMQVRDNCLFRLDLRRSVGDCMRIGGEFGGVVAINIVGGRGRRERGWLYSIRVAYRVGVGMERLGKGRIHSGGSESGKSIGIKRGRENVGEFTGSEGLEEMVGVDWTRNLVGHGG